MAYGTILMTNGVDVKKVPLGFSWTVFFWGPCPPLLRGDWLWGIGLLFANYFTIGVAGVICAFFYNKTYAKGLFDKGYTVHMLPPNVTPDSLKAYLGYINLPGAV